MKPDFSIIFEPATTPPVEIGKKIINFLREKGDVVDEYLYYKMVKNLYTEREFEPLEESRNYYGVEGILLNMQKNNNGQFRFYPKEFDNENCYLSVFEDPDKYFTTVFEIRANTSDGNLAHFIAKDDKWMNIDEVYQLLITMSKLIGASFFVGGYMYDIPNKSISFKDFCDNNKLNIPPCIIGFNNRLQEKDSIINNWKPRFQKTVVEDNVEDFYIIQGWPKRD